MSTKEIWRAVPSLPGVLVSSAGRYMIAPYWGRMPHGGDRPYGGEPGRGVAGDQGRRQVSYKGKCYRLHLLICEAFHGPKPFDGAVVIHIDENDQNNAPDNLKWGTQKENLNAPGFLRYCRSRTGENSTLAKNRRALAAKDAA